MHRNPAAFVLLGGELHSHFMRRRSDTTPILDSDPHLRETFGPPSISRPTVSTFVLNSLVREGGGCVIIWKCAFFLALLFSLTLYRVSHFLSSFSAQFLGSINTNIVLLGSQKKSHNKEAKVKMIRCAICSCTCYYMDSFSFIEYSTTTSVHVWGLLQKSTSF